MEDKLNSDVLRAHKGISFVGVATVFLCYDSAGRIFLAKRSQKARDEKGRWEPGSGGLKWGVSVEENLKRELKEEYNADAIKTDFLGYRDAFRKLEDGTKTHWLGLDFAVLVDSKQIKIMEPEMFDDSGWFDLDNLPSPMHSQIDKFMELHGTKVREILKNSKRT